MSKDKKKKDGKKGKKKDGAGGAASSLKSLATNPLVADVVAATLVSMAAALKDSDKARKLASHAGDQLNALSKKSSKQGNAMWDLALDVGRRTLTALSEENKSAKTGKK